MKRSWEDSDGVADRVLYGLIMMIGWFVRTISRKHSSALARALGDFIYRVPKLRRSLVEENLALTFPEKNSEEISAIALQVYRNQAENFIEMLRLPMIKTAEDAARLLELDARLLLSKTLEQQKGCVLVSAHFGNWELMALCSGLLMAPFTIVVKELKNHAIDRKINSWRTMQGNRIVYDWQALRTGLRTLREGGIVTILGDQSDSGGSFFTEFLGRRTAVFLGPAFLALKAGVPLFVVMCRSIGNGRYTIDIEEIDMSDLGGKKADAEELARRYTKVIERFIYQYPEEWFWLHNRWKRSEP
ncbi:lysophospholipid acyltransferase family protein [Candidatus Chlorobium masyuteum]|uniref:lysophospholipid acyltransferase family protein n=1 Tax=Candidatus Chlorobium masyuteum TaxID=2716876 RepID=UPI001F2825FF|nr:lysophospholipid acyltransferase family protein [Candidatus Chlorobium masyuteum]